MESEECAKMATFAQRVTFNNCHSSVFDLPDCKPDHSYTPNKVVQGQYFKQLTCDRCLSSSDKYLPRTVCFPFHLQLHGHLFYVKKNTLRYKS